MISSRTLHVVLVQALLITACMPLVRQTAPPPLPAASREPANLLRSDYERLVAQGKAVYIVDTACSLVVITVRRGGSLARLGHDHVVASHGIRGYIAPEAHHADLYIHLSELSVDEPVLRAEASLDTQPNESDIVGTRVNMFDKVLNTQQFPFALIHVSDIEQMTTGVRLTTAIALHGVTRTFEVHAQMESTGDRMNVTGSLELNQSDFGIVPLAILGGAVQVQDRINLRFNVYAGVKNQADLSGFPLWAGHGCPPVPTAR